MKTDFEIAFSDLPSWMSGIDDKQMKTVSDLVSQIQFELDLYDEGEQSYITTEKRLREAKEYILKWGNK